MSCVREGFQIKVVSFNTIIYAGCVQQHPIQTIANRGNPLLFIARGPLLVGGIGISGCTLRIRLLGSKLPLRDRVLVVPVLKVDKSTGGHEHM